MKAKHLSLAVAALLAAGGLWFARTAWRANAVQKSTMDADAKMPQRQPQPGQMLRPPDPNRKFRELTPEQRVLKARNPGDVGG